MFNGLGINEELLLILKELDIKYIEILFCGEILETTTDKWLREGIRSPFCSSEVDQQIILPINRITLEDNRPKKLMVKKDDQLSLQLGEARR